MTGVEGLHSIGATARASGLSVGTLRFYDGAGLLRPAAVDPRTGYRYYTDDQVGTARLVAVLRAAGMSLAGIGSVLRLRHDPAAVAQVCAAHLRALEHDLCEARRLLAGVDPLLAPRENPVETTRVIVVATELGAALRAVRFAVSTDPELPALGGVLVDVGDGELTVVATDRYRLATATGTPGSVTGPSTAALVPAALVDAMLAVLDAEGEATLTVDGARIELAAPGGTLDGRLLADPFPDYRALLPTAPGRVTVDAASVAGARAAHRMEGAGGRERDFAVLDVGPDAVWVDREFLAEALDAAGVAGTVLEFAGPAAPITIRASRTLQLLMPSQPPAT